MTIEDRRNREKKERRKTILAAAEKLFASEGFHQTTLERVATEIDISKGTIYLYFKNKEELFFSTFEEKLERRQAAIKPAFEAANSLEQAINSIVGEQIRFLQENKHFFKLLMGEQVKFERADSDEVRKKTFFKNHAKFIESLINGFSRHMENERINHISSKTLTLTIIGSINAHLMNWILTSGESSLEVAKDDIVQIICHGCLLDGNRN